MYEKMSRFTHKKSNLKLQEDIIFLSVRSATIKELEYTVVQAWGNKHAQKLLVGRHAGPYLMKANQETSKTTSRQKSINAFIA